MIALAATLHDATGSLRGDVEAHVDAVRALYPGGVAVATSPPTASELTRALGQAGLHAGTPPVNERGLLYRQAVRAALATGAEHVHYLDFDRVLHWAATSPRELRALLRCARRYDALLVGRTERAHRSHHRPLHATELVANRVMADRLGWPGRVDFLVPSFVLRREAAERLVRVSRARTATLYGEWAALVAVSSPVLSYIECRGLEWETPDRHRAAVAEMGLDAWRTSQDTPEEWRARTAMAEDFVRGFDRARRRVTAPTATLHRLRPLAAR